jgi:ABC-type uncharacterized transport system substrate-binding protein
MRPSRTSLLALVAAGALAMGAARAEPVAVLMAESGGPHAEAAAALARQLPPGVTALTASSAEAVVAARPLVAVGVGTQACERLAGAPLDAALVCLLVPRATFEAIAAPARARGRAVTAVVLDQPPARQMTLIRTALPERRQVGVLQGPAPSVPMPALSAAAARHGLRVSGVRVAGPDEVRDGLQRVLAEADVLLAVPDATVFSTANVQNILRTALERQVPLVGFSAAYARAGAVLALYSTPRQMGEQAEQLVRDALAGGTLPAAQAPRQFEVASNPSVARSLGLQLDADQAIAERVRALEGAP